MRTIRGGRVPPKPAPGPGGVSLVLRNKNCVDWITGGWGLNLGLLGELGRASRSSGTILFQTGTTNKI